MQMEFQPASMAGEECIQLIIRNDEIDLKAQQKLQKKLEVLNTQCQETWLFNRRYFLDQLEHTVEAAINDNQKTYLLLISLDNFTDIRNKLGIINSGHVIADIASLLKKLTDEKNISLARYETSRFTALVNTDNERAIIQLAEDIHLAVDKHITEVKDKSIITTCSIGIVLIDSSCNGSQNCLNHAQNVCDKAAEQGGNQVQLYVPDASEMDDQKLLRYWANEIENAIKQKRLFLMFQPFVSLMGESSEIMNYNHPLVSV